MYTCTHIHIHMCTYVHSCIYRLCSKESGTTESIFILPWRTSAPNFLTLTHRYLQHICNTLQHAAVHCNALQRTATHCNILGYPKTHGCHKSIQCNTLQRTATHCNTLQRTATHFNTLTRTHCHMQWYTDASNLLLQYTATHCNTLQHTATHCNTHTQPHVVAHRASLKNKFKNSLTSAPRDLLKRTLFWQSSFLKETFFFRALLKSSCLDVYVLLFCKSTPQKSKNFSKNEPYF